MIMWPFDAKEERLPTVPNSFGSYVMFGIRHMPT